MSRVSNLLIVTDQEEKEIRKIFKKNAEDIKRDISILLDWLHKQPHLPQPHDINRLERFLLRNKFRIEQTKTKQDKYYTYRVIYSDFFKTHDPESITIENARKSFLLTPMPKLLPSMERIIACQFVISEVEIFNLKDIINHLLMLTDIQLSHDYALSYRFVCDLDGFTLKHIAKMDPSSIIKTMSLYQEAFSGRISGIDFVNISPVFDVLLNLLKRTLSPKLIGRIRAFKDIEALHEAIPKVHLPKEFGGDQDSISELNDQWGKELIHQKEFLENNAKRVSNEKLRIGKSIHNELFGVEGTFKKLNLD